MCIRDRITIMVHGIEEPKETLVTVTKVMTTTVTMRIMMTMMVMMKMMMSVVGR